MVLAGNKEGQVNLNMMEFVDSIWFHNRMYAFISAMVQAIDNVDNPSPEAVQMMAGGLWAKLSMQTREYYRWANQNFNAFIEDYKGFVKNQIGKNPEYVPHSDSVKEVHRTIIKWILPRWLDFKLGRPTTCWHIDNTDPINSYDPIKVKERYGIGKKHFTEEQEKAALERKAAKAAHRESNSEVGSHDHHGIPGVRALSKEDLELF